MPATSFNHVSVSAPDLERSAQFYEELFGLERIPSPTFPNVRTIWLRVGDLQLHLFERDVPAPSHHHLGLTVDDFASVYRMAAERGLLVDDAWGAKIRELPDGSVQMYLRDPAGNMIEVDWPDASTLDPAVVGHIRRIADEVEQRPEAAGATLFLGARV